MLKYVMVKKKELTQEEIKNNKVKALLKETHSLSEPNRFFNIGDKVNYSDFKIKNGVVTDILENGKIIEISYDKETKRTYDGNCTYEQDTKYVCWFDIVKVNNAEILLEEKNRSFSSKFQTYNQTISQLITYHYARGINYNPNYQRDLVWSEEDKEALIDSIFKNYEIGKFALMKLDLESKNRLEILDGKQRLTTVIEFYEDRFTFKGKKFSELSWKDRNFFCNFPVTVLMSQNPLSDEEKYEYFLRMNTRGKEQNEEHIEYVKTLLSKSQESL